MKKIISVLLISLLMFSFVACDDNKESSGSYSENQQSGNETENNKTDDSKLEDDKSQNNKPTDKKDVSDEKLAVFNKNATLSETVMFDKDGVTITATGLNYTKRSVELELTIENNTEKDLSFISGSMGYSCNSINGYMIADGYLNCDVSIGKKANDSISFSYDSLMLYGINEIADIEIGFDISDDDYNHIYTGPCQVKTSAFSVHNYSTSNYQTTIVSRAAMNSYSYEVKHFSKDTLYNEGGVKLLSSGLIKNDDESTILLLELENTTDNMVYIASSNISITGLMVESYTWSSDAINPGKYAIVDVDLSSVFDTQFWNAYGIDEIGYVSLSLTQRNSEGDDITDGKTIEVTVPDSKTKYDSSGEEIYNNNGLRIVQKNILKDSSEHRDDMYILLLAENNSGKTLTIDDVRDSLSINGFMTDYSFYSNEIKNGESTAIEINLRESSLEDNKIDSVSDIKEVELKLEITEDYNTIDKPAIKLSLS